MMTKNLRVPFADLSYQWREIEAEAKPAFDELFHRSAFCLGPWTENFEKNYAAAHQTAFAIGLSSGTAALHLALIAAGIQPGDEVLLPAHTFIATAWPVLYIGAKPILCDVDPVTGTIDPSDVVRRITPKAKAIIPVHLYGQPANLQKIIEIAKEHQLILIEDAAQAHLARYDNKPVGSFGLMGCFSFYPGKNLGAAGESGMIITENPEIAQKVRMLRNHGQSKRYVHEELGFNYRMEGIQGLILDLKLKKLNQWTERRCEIARRYNQGLEGLPLVTTPKIINGDHVFHLYVIRVKARTELQNFLLENGIETGLHYPVPLHHQPIFMKRYGTQISLPETEKFSAECLSLPIYYGMTDTQVDMVTDAVHTWARRQ